MVQCTRPVGTGARKRGVPPDPPPSSFGPGRGERTVRAIRGGRKGAEGAGRGAPGDGEAPGPACRWVRWVSCTTVLLHVSVSAPGPWSVSFDPPPCPSLFRYATEARATQCRKFVSDAASCRMLAWIRSGPGSFRIPGPLVSLTRWPARPLPPLSHPSCSASRSRARAWPEARRGRLPGFRASSRRG